MTGKNSNRFLTIIMMLFITGSTGLYCQTHGGGAHDPEKRNAWLGETANLLKDFNPADSKNKVNIKVRELEGQLHQSYRIVGEGLIRFDSGDWVYIKLHSSHDNDSIGDISLAIDQKGRIYKHEGHVCGGICHYEALAPEKYTESSDFFKNFRDDTDGLSWERYRR